MAAGRYGMKHRTIVYFQQQARDLRLRTDLVAGLPVLQAMHADARIIGHATIEAAAVMSPEKLRAVLCDRTATVARELGINLRYAAVGTGTVNRLLRALGHAERLVAGRGYCYFVDGDASSWFSSSVPVCYVRDLTVGRWIEEHAALKSDRRNHGGDL